MSNILNKVNNVVSSVFETSGETQNALSETEKSYETFLENASLIFFVVDLAGIVTVAAGAGLKSLNLTPRQVVGKTIEYLYRDYPKILDYTRRALEGESFTAVGELSGVTFEVRYNPLHDAQGKLCGTVGVATEITNRETAENKTAALIAELNETADRETLINRLGTAIRSSLKLSDVLHAATHELGKALAASRVYLRTYESQQRDVSPQYIYTAPGIVDPPPSVIRYDQPIGRFILQNRITVVFNDLQNLSPVYGEMHQYIADNLVTRGICSAVYCPILVNDYFHATLCIEQNDCLREWSESDLWLIESIATQLSLSIAHAELFELTRRAKREWEATFDAMSDGVFIFDRNGALRRVNVAGAAMEQSTPQKLIGRNCCQMLLSDNKSENSCIVGQVAATRKPVTVERRSKLLHKPLLLVCEPVFDEKMELAGTVLTGRDLYDLREAEAVAREHQLLFTHLLEGMLEPVFAVNEVGKLLWCNGATREIFGFEGAEIFRRDFLEIVHAEDRELAETALRDSFKKLPQCYESRYLTVKGETRYAILNSVPLVEDNQINGVLWFVRDITEQKMALQEALQADKLRALGQLASGVAHDFNNVLAAILGRVSLLQRRVHDESIARNLQIIQTAAEDAAATVRRIQTFARQSAKSDFSQLELNSLLRDAIEFTRTRWEDDAAQRNILYTVKFDSTEVFFTYGNASELREVFVNLIVNALDAMPRGGAVFINANQTESSIVLKFTDQGEGVADDMRERIFEPFFSTKGGGGMGLGLSVSYSIVKQHGGEIMVETKSNGGATFIVSLPVHNSYQTQTAKTVSLPQTKKKLAILVVDDEDYVREALIEMISELVTDVVGANSGKQALNKLQEQPFDVVFTDLSMPEMDGWELAQNIRQNWNATKTVLVTGYGKGVPLAPENREIIHAILGKPFNFSQLSQTLEKVTA